MKIQHPVFLRAMERIQNGIYDADGESAFQSASDRLCKIS